MALISDPVYGILGSLRNYDPAQNPVLVSHILGRLKLKSITIADKIFEEKSISSDEIESLKSAGALENLITQMYLLSHFIQQQYLYLLR